MNHGTILEDLGLESNNNLISSIFLRNISQKEKYEEELKKIRKDVKTLEFIFQSRDDWTEFSNAIGNLYNFPSSVRGSFAALKDWMTDLSWLDSKKDRFVVFITIDRNLLKDSFFINLIDTICLALAENSAIKNPQTFFFIFIA